MTEAEKKAYNQRRLLTTAEDVISGAEKTGDVGAHRYFVPPRLLDRLATAIKKVRNQ